MNTCAKFAVALAASLSMASPALADSMLFSSSDIGKTVTLGYNGYSSNGGASIAGLTGTGTFTLSFASAVSAMTLSDFYVRYQSITGVPGVSSASGAGIVGLALARRRRPVACLTLAGA